MQREAAPSILSDTSVRWFEAILVVLLAGLIYLPGLGEVKFHGDEGQWISTSRYWEHLLSGDYQSRAWRVYYTTKTQPPVVRYTIGISRGLAGFEPRDLNKMYRFRISREANVRQGRIPSPELLYWSRVPMVVQAALAFGIVFVLVGRSAGRLAAYLSVLLLLVNPYFSINLRRAMGESTLLFWTLLTALTAFALLMRLRRREGGSTAVILLGSLATGVSAGLAGASKLNGLAAIGIGWTIGLGLLATASLRSWRAVASIAVVTGIGCATFVAVNPFLYERPFQRTRLMFENRLDEMEGQKARNPEERLDTLGERLKRIPTRVLHTYAPWRFPLSPLFGLALSLVGLVWLFARSSLLWRRREGGEAALVLLATAALMAGPVLMTPLDWERYYLFPVLFSTIFMSIALSLGVARLSSVLRWRRAR